MERVLKGVKFSIDDARQGPAFFVLGVRKSGSSMFNRVCRLLAKYNSYNFVDVAGSMFSNNINVGLWNTDPSLNQLLLPGNVYGGFRNYPLSIAANPLFRDGKKVLLVRDPRDALVSEYFSNAYSHSVPSEKIAVAGGARQNILQQRQAALSTDIDSYVSQRAELMRATLVDYEPLLDDVNTKLFRYEDIIFNKGEMIEQIADHFGWSCKHKQVEAILGWVDVIPKVENPQQFIRKVTPGDHREKLSAMTLRHLDQVLRDVLATFGYH
ncbi:MAG TPA: sulfotransferase domain-containing protein [Xanthobacteraceae bacterium]